MHMIATGPVQKEPEPRQWLCSFRFDDGSCPEQLKNLRLTQTPEQREDKERTICLWDQGVESKSALLAAVYHALLQSGADSYVCFDVDSVETALGALRWFYGMLPSYLCHRLTASIAAGEKYDKAKLRFRLTGGTGEGAVIQCKSAAPRRAELDWLCESEAHKREKKDKILNDLDAIITQNQPLPAIPEEDFYKIFMLLPDTPFPLPENDEELRALREELSPERQIHRNADYSFWRNLQSRVYVRVRTAEELKRRLEQCQCEADFCQTAQDTIPPELKSESTGPEQHKARNEILDLFVHYFRTYPEEQTNLLNWIVRCCESEVVTISEPIAMELCRELVVDADSFEAVTAAVHNAGLSFLLDELDQNNAYGPKMLQDVAVWKEHCYFSDETGPLSMEKYRAYMRESWNRMAETASLRELLDCFNSHQELRNPDMRWRWTNQRPMLEGKIDTADSFVCFLTLRRKIIALSREEEQETGLDQLLREKLPAPRPVEELRVLRPWFGKDQPLSWELYCEYFCAAVDQEAAAIQTRGEHDPARALQELRQELRDLEVDGLAEKLNQHWAELACKFLRDAKNAETVRSCVELYQNTGAVDGTALETSLRKCLDDNPALCTVLLFTQLLRRTGWGRPREMLWEQLGLALEKEAKYKSAEELRVLKEQYAELSDPKMEDTWRRVLPDVLDRAETILEFSQGLELYPAQVWRSDENEIVDIWKRCLRIQNRSVLEGDNVLAPFYREKRYSSQLRSELFRAYADQSLNAVCTAHLAPGQKEDALKRLHKRLNTLAGYERMDVGGEVCRDTLQEVDNERARITEDTKKVSKTWDKKAEKKQRDKCGGADYQADACFEVRQSSNMVLQAPDWEQAQMRVVQKNIPAQDKDFTQAWQVQEETCEIPSAIGGDRVAYTEEVSSCGTAKDLDRPATDLLGTGKLKGSRRKSAKDGPPQYAEQPVKRSKKDKSSANVIRILIVVIMLLLILLVTMCADLRNCRSQIKQLQNELEEIQALMMDDSFYS